jgi:hypothetical protein
MEIKMAMETGKDKSIFRFSTASVIAMSNGFYQESCILIFVGFL